MKPKAPIYLDYAAATPLDPAVQKAMQPFWADQFANPASLYRAARGPRTALAAARSRVAKVIEARPAEVIFTAGATESINLALLGVGRQFPGARILAAATEHQAVQACLNTLAAEGHPVARIPVDRQGVIDLAALEQLLDGQTVLVSIALASSEIGTIQPWRQIKQLLAAKKAQRTGNLPLYIHTDATAAAGLLDTKVAQLQIEMMTINGAKIYGPKQSACLYVKRGTRLQPLIYGGGQEGGLRAGTENVAAAVGLATALELAGQRRQREEARLCRLRDQLLADLKEVLPDWQLNGHPQQRLANNLNLTIAGVDGEELVLYLDQAGIAAGTGAACSAGEEPSAVLLALGLSREQANSSLRLTLGRSTRAADIKQAAKVLPAVVARLRQR